MKKWLLSCLIMAGGASAVAESAVSEGRIFLKRVENNYANNVRIRFENGTTGRYYNFNSKSTKERLFFGDFNAPVEYYYDPSSEASPDGPLGLRIYPDSVGQYVLEVKRFLNFRDVNRVVEDEFPIISIPWEVSLSAEQEDSVKRRNRTIRAQQVEAKTKRYRVGSETVSIDSTLFESLHKAVVRVIDGYRSDGDLAIVLDGYAATLWAVVDYDVWTLNVHCPTGAMEQLSDLFRQMIVDVEAGTFDEAKYIEALD